MSKEMTVIVLGLLVIAMPYLGIYRSWLTMLMVLTGLSLLIIGFLLRGEAITREHDAHDKKHSKSRNHGSVEQDYSTTTKA